MGSTDGEFSVVSSFTTTWESLSFMPISPLLWSLKSPAFGWLPNKLNHLHEAQGLVVGQARSRIMWWFSFLPIIWVIWREEFALIWRVFIIHGRIDREGLVSCCLLDVCPSPIPQFFNCLNLEKLEWDSFFIIIEALLSPQMVSSCVFV